MYLLKVLLIQSCRLQAWLGPVGSEHVPGRAVWQFGEGYSLQILEYTGKAGGLGNCDMKPALSVMHAKAHSWTCQV